VPSEERFNIIYWFVNRNCHESTQVGSGFEWKERERDGAFAAGTVSPARLSAELSGRLDEACGYASLTSLTGVFSS
jgi:hypothetical protein